MGTFERKLNEEILCEEDCYEKLPVLTQDVQKKTKQNKRNKKTTWEGKSLTNFSNLQLNVKKKILKMLSFQFMKEKLIEGRNKGIKKKKDPINPQNENRTKRKIPTNPNQYSFPPHKNNKHSRREMYFVLIFNSIFCIDTEDLLFLKREFSH